MLAADSCYCTEAVGLYPRRVCTRYQLNSCSVVDNNSAYHIVLMQSCGKKNEKQQKEHHFLKRSLGVGYRTACTRLFEDAETENNYMLILKVGTRMSASKQPRLDKAGQKILTTVSFAIFLHHVLLLTSTLHIVRQVASGIPDT